MFDFFKFVLSGILITITREGRSTLELIPKQH
jgi:hypothetical protein